MGNIRWTNNPSGTLAAGIAPGDTSVTLGSGQGSLFPLLTGAQYSKATIEDVGGNIEVVHITARAGDVLTVARAQEGTVALDFASGSRFELRVTAGALAEFVQRTADTMNGVYDATGGVFSGGNWNAGEVVNSPIRGETGVTSNQLVVPAGGGAPTIGGSIIYTAANLTQSVLNGLAFPVGTIVMWYGSIGGIPAGFQICDGTNGTPDMRDRFAVGAGSTFSVGATGGQFSVTSGPGGGHLPVVLGTSLTVDELPPHTHQVGYRGSNASTQGADIDFVTDPSDGRLDGYVNSGSAGSGNPHSHNTTAVPDHTHTVATAPPYVALYYIMRV